MELTEHKAAFVHLNYWKANRFIPPQVCACQAAAGRLRSDERRHKHIYHNFLRKWKMKPTIKILAVLGLLMVLGPTTKQAWAKYGGGSGTEVDPYLIYDANHMQAIGADSNDWDKHFKLMADIDLSSFTDDSFNIITKFTGVFDGNGNTISNFTYRSSGKSYIGLFSYIDSPNAEIKNLGLLNTNIDAGSNGDYVGSITGRLENGTVIDCFAEGGRVSGNNCVGGLVGENSGGTISGSYTTVVVSGDWAVGGLMGISRYGMISNCHAIGPVAGEDEAGGLVGANVGGTIANCYASGLVDGGKYGYEIGGLVGGNWENSIISESYAAGSVLGEELVGGLVGYNKNTISNCYACGTVTGNNSSVGGLVGASWRVSTISNCYATGLVEGGDFFGGGLVGFGWWSTNDVVIASFWNIETSGQSSSAGGTGKTTAEMQTKNTFTSAGWDFTTSVWTIKENEDYPRLWWENAVPVAVAGPNQIAYAWLDGYADVNLDGSGSYDDDNDVLDYYWSWTIDGNTYEANGVNPMVELPVGEHTIELVVDDGIDLSKPDYCTIKVLRAVRGRLMLSPRVIKIKSCGRWILATLFIPPVPGDKVNTNQPLRLYPSGIEAKYQRFSKYGKPSHSPTIAFAYFDKQMVADALGPGRFEVSVVGEFLSGRFLFGSDTIRITPPPTTRPWWWRRY
jgi:hypothetical protein